MLIISSWLMVLLSSTMCLLIFCLLDLSVFDREVLKFPMIIVDSSISPFSSISFCLTWFGSIVRHVCVHLHSVVFNSWWPHGLQPARLLCPWNFPGKNTEWVAISFSRGSSRPRGQTWVSCISCIGGRVLYHWTTREALFFFFWKPSSFYPILILIIF